MSSVNYLADGRSTKFEVTFPFYGEEELHVAKNGVKQVFNTDYIIYKRRESDGQGNIIHRIWVRFVLGKTPAKNSKIFIKRIVLFKRYSNFKPYGNYSIELLNEEFDKIYLLLKQLNDRFSFVPRLSETSADTCDEIGNSTNRANKLLYFNSSGEFGLINKNSMIPDKLSTAVGTAPSYSSRAQAEIKYKSGTGLSYSGKNLTVTRVNPGTYTISLTKSLASSDYTIIVGSGFKHEVLNKTTAGFKLKFYSTSGSQVEPGTISLVLFD